MKEVRLGQMSKENDRTVSALAREGGLARARSMTPEARQESARKAVKARWAKYRRENGLDSDGLELSEIQLARYRLIQKPLKSHRPGAGCSCGACVDFLMERVRRRYLTVLEKIRTNQILDTGEQSFLSSIKESLADAGADQSRRKERESKRNA
jgi:hypothetical protein